LVVEQQDIWQAVQLSRHPQRPYFLDYIAQGCTEFTELHGDRFFGDDPSLIGGLATLTSGRKLMLLGHQKGRTTKEKIQRNFGMSNPEGYRKAIRLMELAERWGLPVVNLIDTPGAYPGIQAEERGQAEAIAQALLVSSRLATPTISVVIGEGGSGGALALGVSDRVFMLQHATYSVISPEACASILWSDATQAERAARELRLTAPQVAKLPGIIDGLIEEPGLGAHTDHGSTVRKVFAKVEFSLAELEKLPLPDLIRLRGQRLRELGNFGIQGL
jgi:acetyl-CoA carboxylase carboxyl transferase subunit alpha